jgi:hypothetical protein
MTGKCTDLNLDGMVNTEIYLSSVLQILGIIVYRMILRFTAHVLLMYKKYLTVWTVPKFDKANSQKDTKAIPLTQKYTTAHFPGLAQELQYKVAWLTNFMGLGLPLFVKWYDRAIVSQMWVKCQPSHIIRENMICWVVFLFFLLILGIWCCWSF